MFPDHTPDDAFERAVMHAVETLNEPPYAGERLLQAADLVLAGSVTLNGNGLATVKSGSHTYQIDPLEGCTCADSRNRSRHCKHAIAVELLKRAQATLNGQVNGAESVSPTAVSPDTPQPAAWECAQAPSSCTLKWHLSGIELLLTLRAANDDALFSRIKRILPKIEEKVNPVGNSNGQPPDVPDAPRCAIHNAPMRRYSKGDQSWYSHQTPDGQWCRGK